jgi:glycosyltransferase involved in cell wall biosynthesis
MKIIFVVPYPPDESPSQRFRFEQYFEILRQNDYIISIHSFLKLRNWRIFFKPGKVHLKIWLLSIGFLRRFIMLFSIFRYDFVFIHREATPVGPPVFEWIISQIFRRKIIYDFDDAIWLTDRSAESRLFGIIKWRSKVGSICRWSYKISCGNDFLREYALKFNRSAFLIPTTVDTDQFYPDLSDKKNTDDRVVIGWTGSHSTLKYLENIGPTLARIESAFPKVGFLVIADKPPLLPISRITFCHWRKASEVVDLRKVDIGIMPLPDDLWTRGKCGFKALQYMALSIPSVVSPVGVNSRIILHGENGFLAETPQEWLDALQSLIMDETLRKKLGRAARVKVIQEFSVESNRSKFLCLFA